MLSLRVCATSLIIACTLIHHVSLMHLVYLLDLSCIFVEAFFGVFELPVFIMIILLDSPDCLPT